MELKLKPILLVQKSVKNSPSEDKVIEFSENNMVFLVLRISVIPYSKSNIYSRDESKFSS
tara:strand:+ start:395 stop:574 length:180 start_codon:yes stop_codon:yes gene_type:complete